MQNTNDDPKNTTSSTLHEVYVLSVTYDKDPTCVIVPRELLVSIGDQVKFTNLTAEEVRIEFSTSELFGTAAFSLQPEGSATHTVLNIAYEAYPYSVICGGADAYPDKASRPIIVVYK